MEEKIRLDLLLMQQTGYGREFVKELIEKSVLVNGKPITKPGAKFSPGVEIVFNQPEEVYVSRGGYKLSYALRQFGIDLNDKTCLDMGACTGGFTDCMLQNGAARVYTVDIGTGQLDERLVRDMRVIATENTDVRDISPNLFETIDFLTVDLSFISLTKVLHKVAQFADAEGVLLIKPQFEAGRDKLTKRGVVKDKKAHFRVIDSIYSACVEHGVKTLGHIESPIAGHAGNVEYLLFIHNPAGTQVIR